MVGSPKLDRIDINILAHLQQNSRISNVDLAEAVGLSPSPCLARVRDGATVCWNMKDFQTFLSAAQLYWNSGGR